MDYSRLPLTDLIRANARNQGLPSIYPTEAQAIASRDRSVPLQSLQGIGMGDADLARDMDVGRAYHNDPLVKLGWNTNATQLVPDIDEAFLRDNPEYSHANIGGVTFGSPLRKAGELPEVRASGRAAAKQAGRSTFVNEEYPMLLNSKYIGDSQRHNKTRVHEAIHRAVSKLSPRLKKPLTNSEEEAVIRNILRTLMPSKQASASYDSYLEEYHKTTNGILHPLSKRRVDHLTRRLYREAKDIEATLGYKDRR